MNMLKFSHASGATWKTITRRGKVLLAVVLTLAIADRSFAQLPVAKITSIFPAGGRQGAEVEATIAGSDLDEATQLRFSHPGITAKAKLQPLSELEPELRPVPNQFTVNIAADVPPGRYEVRAVGKYGVSNPRTFEVGLLEETLEKEPNENFETAQEVPLDSVVNGRSNRGSDLDFYRFAAKAGQRVLIECRARPLDSRLDAAIAVYGPDGHELARKYDGSLRDTLLDFAVPADGNYVVKLHDFTYGGGDEYVYRLSMSTKPHVDFVFPPAGEAGKKAAYQIYGRNLPGGQPAAGVEIDGRPLEVATAEITLPGGAAAESLPAETLIEPAESGIDAFAFHLPTPEGLAEPALIGFAAAPLIVEQEPNNDAEKPQQLSLPCECVGQFYPQGDQDWFSFDAKQGDKYVIEVISQRQGSFADPFLLVEQITVDKEGKQQVKELKSEDDAGQTVGSADFNARHDDPVYRFTAPADGKYRVLVRDLYFGSRGDPRFVYRLAIRPERPDFRLVAAPTFSGAQANANPQPAVLWSTLLRKGGTGLIDVAAFRRDGFDGEIEVTAEGLPQGISAPPVVVGPGQTAASLVLTAAENAPAVEFAPFKLVGRAKIGDAEVKHDARPASIIWPGQQRRTVTHTRLSSQLALSVSEAEAAPFFVDNKAQAPVEMCRGGQVEIPLAIARHDGFQGPVQLFATDLPKGFQRTNLTIDGKANEGKLKLTIPANAPLGAFSFYLRGTAKHNYRRNPEAAEAAEKRKQQLTQLAAEAAKQLKAAQAAKQEADKQAAAASQKAQATKKANESAVAAQQAAEAAMKTAEQKVETAKKALEGDADNAELAKRVTEAEKQLAAASAEVEKTAQARSEAEKAAAQAAAEEEEAKQKQAAAEKAAVESDARAKAADKVKAAAEKAAAQATNDAKPKSLAIGYPSAPVQVTVTQSPVELKVAAPAGPIKPGEKVELPIEISRLYSYDGQVQIAVAPPKGVAGVKATAAAVPAKQNQTKLVVEAAANATPGKHTLTLTATSKLNNQTQTLTHEAAIEIAPPDPAEKK